MIRPWEVCNVMSTVPTTISGKNSLRFLSLKYHISIFGLYIERTRAFKLIQGDSKLLWEFPWRIKGNPNNNLESLCIEAYKDY
jgi:hypothetical protein